MHSAVPVYSCNSHVPDVTGAETSTKAVVDIYDVFGPAPQTLQGADLLAAALNVLVLVPDFFKGEPAQHEWYVDQSEENKKKKEAFFERSRKFDESVAELLKVVEAAKKKWANVRSWGAFGLCWGGKVSASASTSYNHVMSSRVVSY